MEYVNFYIEKYDIHKGELLLDFIYENEFIYFRNDGVYDEKMHLSGYEPTMILVRNIKTRYDFHEGGTITTKMSKLLEMKKVCKDDINMAYYKRHYANIAFEYYDGEIFYNFLMQPDTKVRSLYMGKSTETAKPIGKKTTPSTLDNLSSDFNVIVANVSHGSTNFIYDEKNLTMFDFGVSIYATEQDKNTMIEKHDDLLNSNRKKSIIISHWDLDHYNLLTSISDEFLKELCCIFIPSKLLSLTSKLTYDRISKHCKCITTFITPKTPVKREVGMKKLCSNDHYALFIGVESINLNKSGIALSVYNDQILFAFSADNSNYQVWECMIKSLPKNDQKYVNVVLSHHGGKSGRFYPELQKGQHGLAIISVGENPNRYPNQEVVDRYIKLGFKIRRTDIEEQDISFFSTKSE